MVKLELSEPKVELSKQNQIWGLESSWLCKAEVELSEQKKLELKKTQFLEVSNSEPGLGLEAGTLFAPFASNLIK